MTTTLIPEIDLLRSPVSDEDEGERAASAVRCTLGEVEHGRRAETLRHGLLGHVAAVTALRDPQAGREGARLRFDGAGDALAREIDEFVAFESQCCGFADFRTGVETVGVGGDALWLDITGPPGTQDFLARWLPGAGAAFEAAGGSALADSVRGGGGWLPKSVGLAGLGLLMCCIAPILGAFGFVALAGAGAYFEAASVVLLGAAAYTWWRGRGARSGASSTLPSQPPAAGPAATSGGDGCGC